MASVRLPKAFLGSQNHSLPDTKADAVLKHMVGTPGVKSVRYFQGQYVPDSTENIAVAPGINACVQDIQETKDRELQKLTVRLSGAGPHVTARHLTDFVESCDRDFHLDMQNKLGNTTYVFEQVAVSSSAAYRGLPGMPKIKASKSRTALPYVQFTKTPFTTNRTLDNVFFEQRPVLRQRLTFFQQHKDWYDKKGQPYMLGLLLHGSPGTGKTSLIKAIANMTGRHIISVSLEAIHTKRQLKHLFQNEDVHVASADGSGQPEIFRIPIGRRLFVLEDIDAASQLVLDRKYQKPVSAPAKAAAGAPKTREEWQRHYADANGGAEEEDEEEDDDALNLATLLNLLDGTVEYPGRIVIMTSNYPERLDKALVRKGRVDLSLRFKKASRAITEEMYENFFDEPWPRACSPLDYEYTPAEVSAILYNNFDAPANAVRDLTARVPAGGDKNAATVVPAAVPEHISDEMRIKRAFGLAA